MICPTCKKKFEDVFKLNRKIYCSQKCYEQSDKIKRKRAKYQREYQLKNSEKIKEHKKKWALKNSSAYYSINKEKIKKNEKIYALKNKEKTRIRIAKRMKNDPVFKLTSNMRKRLGHFLKRARMRKNNKTFNYVGCTPSELRTYLENKFKPGMTWANNSPKGWHVDHIIPLSRLNKNSSEEDIKKITHYTNLQPLWAEENMRKFNK